jgi:hypothetical protein
MFAAEALNNATPRDQTIYPVFIKTDQAGEAAACRRNVGWVERSEAHQRSDVTCVR